MDNKYVEGLDGDIMDLVEVTERLRVLEAKREHLKEKVLETMKENNLNYYLVDVSNSELISVKVYNRVTKSLDKDGLAKDIGEDRDDLDYVGISKLTDKGIIIPSTVEKYLHKNKSSFVMAKVLYKINKGGGSSE